MCWTDSVSPGLKGLKNARPWAQGHHILRSRPYQPLSSAHNTTTKECRLPQTNTLALHCRVVCKLHCWVVGSHVELQCVAVMEARPTCSQNKGEEDTPPSHLMNLIQLNPTWFLSFMDQLELELELEQKQWILEVIKEDFPGLTTQI